MSFVFTNDVMVYSVLKLTVFIVFFSNSPHTKSHKKHRGGMAPVIQSTPATILAQFGNVKPENIEQFQAFFRCLTACHTVVREKNGESIVVSFVC